jgi:hypothetical protein
MLNSMRDTIMPDLMDDQQLLIMSLKETYTVREISELTGLSKSMVDKITQNALKWSNRAKLSTIYQELYS